MPHRLLILNTDLELGGTPMVVRELATRLHDPPRTEVQVACLGRWGPVADQIHHAGIRVTALAARGVRDLGITGKLIHLLRDRQINTLFSFLLHANAIATLAHAVEKKVRFFQSIQTTQPYPAWHWRVQSILWRSAEKIIVPSQSVADVARAKAHVPAHRLRVIPNAIDPANIARSDIPFTHARPFPIGFIGRFDPVKRITDLIDAMSDLRGLVHLHLFGDGPDRPAVVRRVAALQLEPHVTLHGFAPRDEALRQIGVLVLPSASEGMPMVLIEAMAAGVPVIGRDVPGVRDVIQPGQTGLLAHSDSISSLRDCIEKLVNDHALRQQLARQASDEVRRLYTWDQVIPRYVRELGLP